MLNSGPLRCLSQPPQRREQALHRADVVGPPRPRSGRRTGHAGRGWRRLRDTPRQHAREDRRRRRARPRLRPRRRGRCRAARHRQRRHLMPSRHRRPGRGRSGRDGHRRTLRAGPITTLSRGFLHFGGIALGRNRLRPDPYVGQRATSHGQVRPRPLQPQVDQQRLAGWSVELTHQVVRPTSGHDEIVELIVRRRGQVARSRRTPPEHGQRYAGTVPDCGARTVEHLSHCSVSYAAVISSRNPEQFLKHLAEHRMNNARLQRVAVTGPPLTGPRRSNFNACSTTPRACSTAAIRGNSRGRSLRQRRDLEQRIDRRQSLIDERASGPVRPVLGPALRRRSGSPTPRTTAITLRCRTNVLSGAVSRPLRAP